MTRVWIAPLILSALLSGCGGGDSTFTPAPVSKSVTAALSSTQPTTFKVGAGAQVATLTFSPSAHQDTITVTASTTPPAGWTPLLARRGGTRPNDSGSNGALNPGLYVQVVDGSIAVTGSSGTQTFSAGQFGFTPGFQQPPIILPTNPGLQFTPPAAFGGSQGNTFAPVSCTLTGTPSNNGYTFSNVPIVATRIGTTYALLANPSSAQGCSSPSPSPSPTPTAAPTGTPTIAPTPSPAPTGSSASECVAGSNLSLPAGPAEEFLNTTLTTAQATCVGFVASSVEQILLVPNTATAATFNLWIAAPHGIVVPSTLVTNPQVFFAIELTANPSTTFVGSGSDALFQLSLQLASVPSGTIYAGYCQENSAQTGCVSGTTLVDQIAVSSGSTIAASGLSSGSVTFGSTPYLIELYY